MHDLPKDLFQTRWSLIQRLKNLDDNASWQEFFDTHWRLICSVASKSGLTHMEAEGVVQETILSVTRKIGEFRADPAAGSFKSWLLTLTRWRISRGKVAELLGLGFRDTEELLRGHRVPYPIKTSDTSGMEGRKDGAAVPASRQNHRFQPR